MNRVTTIRGRRLGATLCAALLAVLALQAQQPAAPAADDPNRWEPTMLKFEEADRLNPPKKGGIVFVGASSIVRWNLEESFPDLKGIALNRGFGGSYMSDSAKYASRIVVPYAPKVVVLYPGENDIARGVTAETVGLGFIRFYETVHTALPNSRIVAIGLKPTPARWKFDGVMQDANKLIKAYCEGHAGCVYMNVRPDMLGVDGTARTELFVADMQHMSPAGYAIWNRLVRPYLTTGN